MKKILLSLLLVVSSSIAVAEEKQDTIVLADNTTFANHLIDHATGIVQSTVKLISTPIVSSKDVECLARNIFYEAANEPEEGKVAVAMVTLNRASDPRFGSSICEVVKARTVVVKTREVKKAETIRISYFSPLESTTKKVKVTEQVPVCQFSWYCSTVRKPKIDDERWIQSQEIARNIVQGDYERYREKYRNALFFHATGIRPAWAKQKRYLTRVGGHIFYE